MIKNGIYTFWLHSKVPLKSQPFHVVENVMLLHANIGRYYVIVID